MSGAANSDESKENYEAFEKAYADDSNSDTKYNLAVVGLTGAGKSTLVNAVLKEVLARTGTGEPVTRGVNYYENAAKSLGLYDFEGIETGQDLESVTAKFRTEFVSRLVGDPKRMIHGVWYCVRSSDLRFEDGQARIVADLAGLGVPVLLVLTRVALHPELGIDPKVKDLAESIRRRGLPIVTGRPILVNAEQDLFSGHHVHGLDRLVELTDETAPEGVKSAWAAAQRISYDKKRRAASQTIAAAAGAAALVGLTPAPGADSLAIVPIQAGMMRKIARIYQIEIEATTVAGAMATMAATLAGRAAYTALLKLIPGFGNVAAGVVAAGFTTALGTAWHQLCSGISNGIVDAAVLSDYEELGKALLVGLKEQLEKLRGEISEPTPER